MPLLDIYGKTRPKMQEVVDRLVDSLKNIHTGRASTTLVEDIQVDYYGSKTPLRQIANIGTPDATLITITPWDKGMLGTIETAVRESGRNISPSNDGTMIRIALPPMSTQRREEMVKLVHKMAEESRIALRTIRKEAWETVQEEVKASLLTEDDRYIGERDLNKMIDEYNDHIAQSVITKEKEIRTI